MSRFLIVAIITLILALVFYLTIWKNILNPSPKKLKTSKEKNKKETKEENPEKGRDVKSTE